MVYRGKPSASCQRCRTRRLRCNYGKPSCAACIRAGATCTGYRDQSEYGFQNQNEETIRNYYRAVNKKHAAAVSPAPSDHSTEASVTLAVSASSSNGSPRTTLAQPIQDVARCHLYANYMTGGPRTRHMAYLVPLIEANGNRALNAAVSAVALAAFSNIHASPKTMVKAHTEYAIALSETNLTLMDPELCKTDGVLATVIMLGMFEIISCIDTSFVDRWMNHLNGAAKLLELRGPEQLARPAGLEMFTQLRAQIMKSLSRIYQEKHDAPILTQLNEQAFRYRQSQDRMPDSLGKTVIKLADFVADVKEGFYSEPAEIIRSALSIDAELVSALIAASPPWDYQDVVVPKVDDMAPSPYVLGNTYHVYESLGASSMWNNYRCARIMIQELVVNTLSDIDSGMDGQAASFPQKQLLEVQCRQTALQLVEDICASVPFSLGSELEASDDDSPMPSSTSSGFSVNGAGGFTLMWPLLVAANSWVTSDDMRTWIAECLTKIGHSTGINQALAASKLLRDRMVTRAWLSPEYEFSSITS